MKNRYAFMSLFLVLFLYGGCGDDNNIDCEIPSEPLTESECLAEDMENLCFFLICQSAPAVNTTFLSQSLCTATDCFTLECPDRSITELAFDSEGNLFSTVFLDDVNLGNVRCQFAQP